MPEGYNKINTNLAIPGVAKLSVCGPNFNKYFHLGKKFLKNFIPGRLFELFMKYVLKKFQNDVVIISLCYTFSRQYTTAASFIFGLTRPI